MRRFYCAFATVVLCAALLSLLSGCPAADDTSALLLGKYGDMARQLAPEPTNNGPTPNDTSDLSLLGISGRVLDCTGYGVPSVTLCAAGGVPTATTDDAGCYTLHVKPGWSGTITPQCVGYTFEPPDRVYTSVPGDCGGQDYIAVDGPVIYVDKQLSSSTCTTYNVATRSCGSGTATAYKTLAGAAAAATAGTTVRIRAGTFTEALAPQRSGTAAQYITYEPYGDEVVTITGSSLAPAIDISNRSYLRIRGLAVSNVQRWLLAVSASHNILEDNSFLHALDGAGSSKTGLFFEEATYNRIVGNTLDDSTQDHLSLIASDRNLVEGNTFTRAEHTLWTIKCGNYNILRGNYFHNLWQKIGEVYDCDGVGVDHDITRVNSTKHNLIEGNVFAYTASSGDASPFAGIQYAAQSGIIRNNVFYDTIGPALDMTVYSDEAEYNTDNRVYANVFYSTDFAGINIAPSGYTLSGNLFKNNILNKSIFVRNDTRWDWYIELNGKPVNLLIGRQSGFVFDHNDLFDVQTGQTYVITYGQRDSSNGAQHNVAWWQSNSPTLFTGNLEADPRFVNGAAHDFHLQSSSPMIDAGTFLTRTAAAGSGTALRVLDATYFCDGYGIEGETGDVIRLQGTTQAARVVAINYTTNTLTVDSALSWSNSQGVSLDYAGSAPDVGAFEHIPGS